MGEEGLLERFVAAISPPRSLGHRRYRNVGAGKSPPHAECSAAAAPPGAALLVFRTTSGRRSTSLPVVGWCSATMTCASPTWPRGRHRRCTATQSATNTYRSRRARVPWKRCSARCRFARAITWCCPVVLVRLVGADPDHVTDPARVEVRRLVRTPMIAIAARSSGRTSRRHRRSGRTACVRWRTQRESDCSHKQRNSGWA